MYRIALFLVSVGCGRVAFDPLLELDAGSQSDGSPAACACADRIIEVRPGLSANRGFDVPGDRGLAGSCGGTTGAEAIVEIRAEVAGTYMLRMPQEAPTTLYIRDGCCTGPELDCTNTAMPMLAFQLAAGQSVVAIADGMSVGDWAVFNVRSAP